MAVMPKVRPTGISAIFSCAETAMTERELESGFTTRQKVPSPVAAMVELDRLMVA